MTNELRRLKTSKRAALRQYTKHRTPQLKCRYLRLNKEYKRVSQRSYSLYQRGIQRKLRANLKAFWNFVNEQRKESGLPSSMLYNGRLGSSTSEICQLFGAKFAEVFSTETLDADQVNLAVNGLPIFSHSLSTFHIDESMIADAASQLKTSFNPGPDGVPPAFLKTNIDHLLHPLCRLFRLSLSCGTFPSLE